MAALRPLYRMAGKRASTAWEKGGRAGKIPARPGKEKREYKGSTFTVSNLGMFGIELFTPIVNQPNAAILGVCASHDELVMDDEGTITKHQIMQLCLTYDHRLMDGAVAARFGMDLRDILEKPMGIIL